MNEDDAKPDWAQDNYDPTEPENYSRFVTPLYTELQDFLEKIGHNPWKDDEGKDITDSSVEPGTPPSETAVAPRLDEAPPPSETAVKPYLLTTPPPSDTASVARPTQPSPSSTTPSDKPAPSTTPAPTQRPATTTPRPVTPAAKAPEGGIVSKLFGGTDYQSNHRPVVENGVINWGNPDNPADFARASKVVTEMMYGGGSPSASAGRSANYISAGYYGDGTTPPVLRAIRSAESSNNPNAQNPRSSAGGLYQFTDATWGSVLRRMDPEVYGSYGDKQLSFLKKNEKLQEAAAQFHLENDILPKLKKNNIPATAGNIYLSWFQGPEGAVRAYNAPDNALVAQVFPATVKPNAPMKLDGKPYAEWTMRDLRTFTDRAMARRMRAEGGRTPLLQDQFPTHYLPDVGRQVMNSGGTPEDDAVRLAYQITTDPMGNPTVAQAQEQPEGKREGLYERAVDVMSAPFRTYAEKTKEAAEHGSHLMSESGKSLRMEDGRLPINAVPLYTMGALGTLFSPLTGAAETIGEGVKQMTGNPEAGNRASFIAGMIDPSHAGAFAKAGTLAMVPMAGKAAEAVNIAKRELSPLGLYSHGEEMARSLPQERGTPEQFAGMLAGSKYGVKPVELEGFKEAFAGKPQITREEAAQYFRQNLPQIEEKVYGSTHNYPYRSADDWQNAINAAERRRDFDEAERLTLAWEETEGVGAQTKYQSYTLPGGENYREVVLKTAPQMRYVTLDEVNAQRQKISSSLPMMTQEEYNSALASGNIHKVPNISLPSGFEVKPIPYTNGTRYGVYDADGNRYGAGNTEAEALETYNKLHNQNVYQSSHWEDPNVIAHIRLADRTGPNNEKILHVEEMQSDWAQEGRKKGFNDPTVDAKYKELYDAVEAKKREQVEKHQAIHAQFEIDSQPFREAYKKAMEPAELKLRASRNTNSDISEYNAAADQAFEQTRYLLDPLEEKKQQAYKALREQYEPEINALEQQLSALPKRGEIPFGPYVSNTQAWTDLALKRVLNEAAKGGYDKVVFTPGAEQVKRYRLSNHVDRLVLHNYSDGMTALTAYRNGEIVTTKTMKNAEKELPDLVGKEVAQKLIEAEPYQPRNSNAQRREISGQDLDIGGSGMKGYYDKIVPTQLQKLVKKLDPDAKFGKERIAVEDRTTTAEEISRELGMSIEDINALPREQKLELINSVRHKIAVPSLEITPKMRENILRGLAAYADGGAVDDNQTVNRALEMTRHFGSHI